MFLLCALNWKPVSFFNDFLIFQIYQSFLLINNQKYIKHISQQLKMGNNHQKIYTLQNFDPNDYYNYSAEKKKHHQLYGQFTILKHHITNEMVDRYQVSLNSREDFENYMQQFYWRAEQDTLVNTVHLKQKHEEGFCSTTYIIDVYIEHIASRLSEVTDIPHLDNLYLLKRSLQGFQKIFKKQGYIKVKESHICFDTNGIVKVWLNQNLSKNYPDPLQNNSTTQNKTESDMVNEIIKIVSENADNDCDLISFENYYNQQKIRNVTFQEALDIVQKYQKIYRVQIPDFFEAIVRMIDKSCDENHEHFQEIHDHGIFNPPKESARFPEYHNHEQEQHKGPNFMYSQPPVNAIQTHYINNTHSQLQPKLLHQSHIQSTKKHSPQQRNHLDTLYTLANRSSQNKTQSPNFIHFQQRNENAKFPIQKIQKVGPQIMRSQPQRLSPIHQNVPIYRTPITHQPYQSNIVQPLPVRNASYSHNKPQVKIFFNNNPVKNTYHHTQTFAQRQRFQRPTSLQKTVNIIRNQFPQASSYPYPVQVHQNQVAVSFNSNSSYQRKSESPNKIIQKKSPISEHRLLNALQQENVAQASFEKDLQQIKNQQIRQSKNRSFHNVQQTKKNSNEKEKHQYLEIKKEINRHNDQDEDQQLNELKATKKYYTVQAEAEIDPQIAADLLIYENDGDLS